MLDLFAMADANATAVQTAFESLVVTLPSLQAASLHQFAQWVEAEALIAINARLFVVLEILNGKGYQNTYEWAQEQSRLCGRTIEDALRERLGAFYERRTTFDRAFNGGEAFRYGALNAGGAGLTGLFNPYCVVLKRSFQESLGYVAYLPGDSLKICFAADGSLDPVLAARYATPHTRRHFMTAKERASEITPLNECEWPTLVASADRYFEVVFVGEISLDVVECVRVLKKEHDRMWEMAFANFGRKLDDAERALVQDFIQLRRAVVEDRVRLEVLR